MLLLLLILMGAILLLASQIFFFLISNRSFIKDEINEVYVSFLTSVQRYDPTYEATRLHFEDLAGRYGNPIIVLNLIKVIFKCIFNVFQLKSLVFKYKILDSSCAWGFVGGIDSSELFSYWPHKKTGEIKRFQIGVFISFF